MVHSWRPSWISAAEARSQCGGESGKSGSNQLSHSLQQGYLCGINFLLRHRHREEFRAVNLGEFQVLARFRRPFESDNIAANRRRIAIPANRPCVDNFPRFLPDLSETKKWPIHFEPQFLLKLAPCCFERLFAWLNLPLWNRPGTDIFIAPKWPTRELLRRTCKHLRGLGNSYGGLVNIYERSGTLTEDL